MTGELSKLDTILVIVAAVVIATAIAVWPKGGKR